MTTSAIDLSQLPFPDVVEVIDYETLYAARKAALIARTPAAQRADIAAALELESEPITILLQESSYRETIMRQRVNDSSRAVYLATAQRADLDNVAARVNVQRLTITPADETNGIAAVMESDADLRRRALLAPLGYSVAGPAGAYVFHSLTADAGVLDAWPKSPAAGEVVVSVLSRTGDGTASADLLAKVRAALSAEDVRPLTDKVTVQSASIVTYRVEAKLFMLSGPDASVAIALARSRLDAYVAECKRINREVAISGVMGALHVAGVDRVQLIQPVADVITTDSQAPHCTAITITQG